PACAQLGAYRHPANESVPVAGGGPHKITSGFLLVRLCADGDDPCLHAYVKATAQTNAQAALPSMSRWRPEHLAAVVRVPKAWFRRGSSSTSQSRFMVSRLVCVAGATDHRGRDNDRAYAPSRRELMPSESQGRHHKQINGRDRLRVVAEECLPGLRRRPTPHHVFRDRRLGDLKAEHQQLAVDPRCSPPRVFLAHPSDEIAQLAIDLWPPCPLP